MTITVHPVVGWAWLVVGALAIFTVLLALITVLRMDIGPDWLAEVTSFLTMATVCGIALALMLTMSSFIF